MVNSIKAKSVPPPPGSDNPYHPERLPPNIPIPGKPEAIAGPRSYKCKKCGKVYSSKEELEEHMHEEHSA